MTGVHQLLDLSNQGAYADKFPAILLCMNAIAAQQWSPGEGDEYELTMALLWQWRQGST
jgi:hypothetical protein